MNRQDFIKTTTAAAFGFQFIPRRVLGDGVSTPPSRKIHLAAIGCGGQAAGDLSNMADENIVALCDVDEREREQARDGEPDGKCARDGHVASTMGSISNRCEARGWGLFRHFFRVDDFDAGESGESSPVESHD